MSGVTLKMSGEYRCVAVNSAGEAVCAAKVSVVGEFIADSHYGLMYSQHLFSFWLDTSTYKYKRHFFRHGRRTAPKFGMHVRIETRLALT